MKEGFRKTYLRDGRAHTEFPEFDESHKLQIGAHGVRASGTFFTEIPSFGTKNSTDTRSARQYQNAEEDTIAPENK